MILSYISDRGLNHTEQIEIKYCSLKFDITEKFVFDNQNNSVVIVTIVFIYGCYMQV